MSSGSGFAILSLFLLLLQGSGRSVSPENKQSLDVSAALDGALRVGRVASLYGASGAYQQQEIASGGSETAALSVQVESRDFLPPLALAAAEVAVNRTRDYKEVVLGRLRRDEARVRGIEARVALAVGGTRRSDLVPEMKSVGGPVVSGTSEGSGEYFARVEIGTPARAVYMVVDTGSDVTWLQCRPCAYCYEQSDPVFDPAASSSYSPLSCDSPQCRQLDISACANSSAAPSCLYQVSYGDGSYTVGTFATETLTFGKSAPVAGVALGCGHDNEGLFVGAAGLLGLGGGGLSFPSQLSSKSFSYCLVDRDSPSSSTLEFGPAPSAGEYEAAAPLLRNGKVSTFYYVGLEGISVGGARLSIPASAFAMDDTGAGGVIVDSGTAVTRLRNDAYNSLRDAFRRGTAALPPADGVALFDTCYDLSSRAAVEVPTVSFHFTGGGELRLPAKNYLIPVEPAGKFCLAFAPTAAPLSIIGNVQQQGTRVVYDVESARVGFTPNKC